MMLFDSYRLGSLTLQNRVAMAPMTRSRATADHVPTDIMANYYAQRAGAGLLITEGTSPSPHGLGYPRIPGIYSDEMAAGWKKVADAVHEKGAAIFIQLMHTGRVSALGNMPKGARVLSSTDRTLGGQMYTDVAGPQPHDQPSAMTEEDIAEAIEEFVTAASLARQAGIDGVEIHGANGYLVEQFLNANINTREDAWGGSAEHRNRFAVELATRLAAAIGKDRVGIRLSPHGVFNETGAFEGVESQYESLVSRLSQIGIAYVHVLDHSSQGAPPVPETTKSALREAFRGSFILCGGFDNESAEAALQAGRADLIAFGRPFIANPDLVARMKSGKSLAEMDPSLLYTPGSKGYDDYQAAT